MTKQEASSNTPVQGLLICDVFTKNMKMEEGSITFLWKLELVDYVYKSIM